MMRATSPAIRMLASPAGETGSNAEGNDGDDAANEARGGGDGDALLASFASRLEEEGGATKLQLENERERASRTVRASSEAAVKGLTKLVDLDSEKVQTARPQGGDGLLDVQSWRLTVAFFVLTIALALFSAATTDFGDGHTELGGASAGTLEVRSGVDNVGVDYLLGRR